MNEIQGPGQLAVGRCICSDNPYSEKPRGICPTHDYTDRGGVELIKTWDLYDNRTDDYTAWELWANSGSDETDYPCTCPMTGCDRYEFTKPNRGCEQCFETCPCGPDLPPMPRA